MHELALFAGAGGGILGGQLLGWNTRCAVEIDPYCRNVLLSRQRDGALPKFPIWDDIRTFKGRPWRGSIDVITGGFPCQDISAAGKGRGLAGARSGLWFEMLRVIGEVKPRFVFAENSPNLRTRGLGTVIEGLTSLGYDVRWCVLGAGDVGAPHLRRRMWILATDTNRETVRNKYGRVCRESRERTTEFGHYGTKGALAHTAGKRSSSTLLERVETSERDVTYGGRWPVEPDVGRVAHGVAHRVDRLKALGNGQVPRVAATAWRILNE